MSYLRKRIRAWKKKLPADLPGILSKLRKEIVWKVRPDEADMPVCGPVISAFLNSGGDLDAVTQTFPDCRVVKLSYRKLIIRCAENGRQVYFKIFFPDYSIRWKRGLNVFPTPAAREAKWMARVSALGIDCPELLGMGETPWANRASIIQKVSYLVTSTPEETRPVATLINEGLLTPEQRLMIAGRVLDIVNTLHDNNIGHLDTLQKTNVLFQPSTGKVLLSDLERTSRIRFLRKSRRKVKDFRNVHRTLHFLSMGPVSRERTAS